MRALLASILCAFLLAGSLRVSVILLINNIYGGAMQSLLFTCVVLTLINVYLLIYINTLWLYPKKWIKKTNSNSRSFNPRVNNQACAGITVTITAALMCVSWAAYFYALIF